MRRARVVQFATVALVALATGCTQDTSTIGPTTNDPLVAKLISLGYRADMIEDRGDNFLVEGDMVFSKRDLAELVDQGEGLRPSFQWRTTNLVAQTNVQNIGVSLSGLSTLPAYQTAARAAIVEWNRVNCSNVRFYEGSPVRINFRTFSDATRPGLAAQAPGPSSTGLPGSYVEVNLRYTGPISDAIRKFVMVHEMGHTIGFRHSDWQGKETAAQYGGAILIPGTPEKDAHSVMNTGVRSSSAFSGFDNKATSTLYPNTNAAVCLRPTISGPSTAMPYQTCRFTATPNGGVAPYYYSWNGSGYVLNGSVYLQSNSGSSFGVSVSVKDANGRIGTANHGVTVYQYGPPC